MLGVRREPLLRQASLRPDRGPSDVRRVAGEVADQIITDYRRAAVVAVSARIAENDDRAAGQDKSDDGWVAADYTTGLSVRHAAFGSGTVKGATGSEHGIVVVVDFADGPRSLQGGTGYLIVPDER